MQYDFYAPANTELTITFEQLVFVMSKIEREFREDPEAFRTPEEESELPISVVGAMSAGDIWEYLETACSN